jgi:hypothetical protein
MIPSKKKVVIVQRAQPEKHNTKPRERTVGKKADIREREIGS